MKTLIVYYSLSGNTKYIAELVKEVLIDASIERVEVVEDYPTDSSVFVKQARNEIKAKTGPKIKKISVSLTDYDTIVIATPNWGNTMAPAVRMFLEENLIENKTVLPIITHGGTKAGKYIDDLTVLTKNTTILNPLIVWQKNINLLTIKSWLNKNNILE